MSQQIATPFTSEEIITNCQTLIAAKADKKQFENMAIAIVCQMSESQQSPSSLRRKLGELREELNDTFKNVSEYTKIVTKLDNKTKEETKKPLFLLSEIIKHIEDATGIQDGKATKVDYPRISDNILIYAGKKSGEIVLRESMVTEVKETEIPTTETTETTDNETPKTPATIDATAYIELAKKQLKSDEWTDIAIGVAMLTLRREVEVCAAMSFEAKDEYTLIINTPTKKRTNTQKYYEIPSLIPSDEVEEAIERMRSMVNFERFDIQKQLGNPKKANVEFNSCYKQPLLDRYNEFMRKELNTDASVDNKDYFHKLRDLGASIWKQAKRDSYKIYSPKYDNEVLLFASGVLVHEGTSATAKYGNWDVSNVPMYVVKLTTRSYGNVIKKDEKPMNLVSFDIAALHKGIAENEKALTLFSEIFNQDRVKDPLALGNALIAVFTQAVKEPEKNNALLTALSPKTARGAIGGERIALIVNAMFKHNEASEYKVFVCESQVRAAYAHIYGEQVSFDLVRKVFTDMGSTVNDHNEYKKLSTTNNLKLRGEKIKSVYDSLKQLVTNEV